MHCYRAYNLAIRSELPFPDLSDCTPLNHDVAIQFGEVSRSGLSSPKAKGLTFQSTQEEFWFEVPSIARFLISHGNAITIERLAGAQDDTLRLFVLTSCFAAILQQRGFLVLRGTTIHKDGHCVSFIGAAGSGKSTLAAALLKRGYSLLSDDTCAIDGEGRVLRGLPQLHLWADSARKLEMDLTGIPKVRAAIEKYLFPIENNFQSENLPMNLAYVIHVHNKPGFEFVNVSGMEKLDRLKNNYYRSSVSTGDRNAFLQTTKLANQISLVRLLRPQDGFSIHPLADKVEADIRNRHVR